MKETQKNQFDKITKEPHFEWQFYLVSLVRHLKFSYFQFHVNVTAISLTFATLLTMASMFEKLVNGYWKPILNGHFVQILTYF